MEDQQRLAALNQLRDELARKPPGGDAEKYSKTLASLTNEIDRLKEKIGPAQEPPKLVITTSQWLGAISFAFSIAAFYYKQKERKKLFEALSD